MGTNIFITNHKKISSQGFTIVELLIVVVVIAILAAITIVAYNGVTKRAAESAMQTSIKQIGTSIGVYKIDNSTYPSSLAVLGIDESLYSNKDSLWAYTTTGETFCLSTGSKTSSSTYHISDANGAPTTGLCGDHTVGMLSSPTSPAVPVTNFPSRGGYTDITLATASSPADNTEVQIGSVPVGGWMVVVFSYTNSADPVAPSGWTTILPRHTTGASASFQTSAYAKIKQSGDANQQYFDAAGSNGETTLNGVLMWGTNSAPVSSWIIGSFADRVNNATSTTTVTPTLTTTVAKTLVLSIATERTAASETNYTSLTGVTPWVWIPQVGTLRIQTIAVGYEEKAVAGTSQAMTVTYPNAQATNGFGIQIAIPPAP